jgi:hypothetical protein
MNRARGTLLAQRTDLIHSSRRVDAGQHLLDNHADCNVSSPYRRGRLRFANACICLQCTLTALVWPNPTMACPPSGRLSACHNVYRQRLAAGHCWPASAFTVRVVCAKSCGVVRYGVWPRCGVRVGVEVWHGRQCELARGRDIAWLTVHTHCPRLLDDYSLVNAH